MAPSGLRERKKARTQRAIAIAALALFELNGYEGTSVEQIAESADVSRRTFFRYFHSKEDVLLARPERLTQALEDALAEAPDLPPVERVERALLSVARLVHDERDLLVPALRLGRTESQLRARLARLRVEWEGLIARVLLDDAARLRSYGRTGGASIEARRRAGLAAAMTAAAFLAALEGWSAEPSPGSLEVRVAEAFEVLRGGLDRLAMQVA